MSVRYRVEHQTRYVYSTRVSTSQHVACLRPRELPKQRVRAFAISYGPEPSQISERIDYFGNWAEHFTIYASSARIRDAFDVKRPVETQILKLSAPTPGRTLDARVKLGARRRAQVKAGAEVKRRGPQQGRRIMRLGTAHRPTAMIKGGNVITATAE